MLHLIATPIGNIADISIRAIAVLESCDEILCEDTRVAKKLISLLNERGLLKRADFHYTSFHSHNEFMRIEQFDSGFFDRNVAFLSDAGMPCVSDPGAKLVAFLQKNDLPYSAVSGACSVVLAYALSGFEGGFSFLGFIPHKFSEKQIFLQNALQSPLHCICFESPRRILDSLELLCKFAPKRKIFIAKELTKMHETLYFGEIYNVYQKLKKANLNGEWAIVIHSAENVMDADNGGKTLNRIDIKSLDIPPKIKAKLLAKIDGRTPKECYDELLNEKE